MAKGFATSEAAGSPQLGWETIQRQEADRCTATLCEGDHPDTGTRVRDLVPIPLKMPAKVVCEWPGMTDMHELWYSSSCGANTARRLKDAENKAVEKASEKVVCR